jgi:uncharacterized phage protein (TIGR02216 family)
MSGLAPFPWEEAMQFGFGVLRLSSASFWALTPRELAAAFEARSARSRVQSPLRRDLETLMATFPDTENHDG